MWAIRNSTRNVVCKSMSSSSSQLTPYCRTKFNVLNDENNMIFPLLGWKDHNNYVIMQQPRQQQQQQQRRWNTTDIDNSKLIYTSPMAQLVSRLKIVSITSCVMSVVGLPLFIALKNGDLPTVQQLSLGGVAFLGATGSTAALHFVFGPYILTMEQIPVRQCHYPKDKQHDNNNDGNTSKQSNKKLESKVSEEFLIKATTRSVFGWMNEIIFNPQSDVTPYSGVRPFANFVAKDVTLYAHVELIEDDTVRQQLFGAKASTSVETVEGIPSTKKKDKDDDGFL